MNNQLDLTEMVERAEDVIVADCGDTETNQFPATEHALAVVQLAQLCRIYESAIAYVAEASRYFPNDPMHTREDMFATARQAVERAHEAGRTIPPWYESERELESDKLPA